MPRRARIVKPGLPYHVTQRGNYRQTVFEDEDDYAAYKKWLIEYSRRYDLEILSWCLMPNHVHFICVPNNDRSMAQTFNTLHMRYSQLTNYKKGEKGHLWQGRFYSCPFDEAHLYAAVKYVENNPVRAEIVQRAENYKWSSAKEHLNAEYEVVSGKAITLLRIKDWSKYLDEKQNDDEVKTIRAHTFKGVPLGGEDFIRRLENFFKIDLKLRGQGRPRKKKS